MTNSELKGSKHFLEQLGIAQAKGLLKFKIYAPNQRPLVTIRVWFNDKTPKANREKFANYVKENYDIEACLARGLHNSVYEFDFYNPDY